MQINTIIQLSVGADLSRPSLIDRLWWMFRHLDYIVNLHNQSPRKITCRDGEPRKCPAPPLDLWNDVKYARERYLCPLEPGITLNPRSPKSVTSATNEHT